MTCQGPRATNWECQALRNAAWLRGPEHNGDRDLQLILLFPGLKPKDEADGLILNALLLIPFPTAPPLASHPEDTKTAQAAAAQRTHTRSKSGHFGDRSEMGTCSLWGEVS